MKTSLLFFLLPFTTCQIAFGQIHPERQVLAVAGGYGVATNGISVSWTVGEVATATLTDGTIVLTQGFQQPDSTLVVPTIELPYGDLFVKIFPNPAHDVLTVELPELPTTPLLASLTDATGRSITEQKLTGLTTTFDMHQLPAAMYFLYITDGKSWMKSVRVLKQ